MGGKYYTFAKVTLTSSIIQELGIVKSKEFLPYAVDLTNLNIITN
jgi:hypothetical protein